MKTIDTVVLAGYMQIAIPSGQQGRNSRPGGAIIGGQPGTEFPASRLGIIRVLAVTAAQYGSCSRW